MQIVIYDICNYFLYALDIVSFIVAVLMIVRFITSLVSDYHEEKRKNKLKHYKLKIIFTNRETLDELVDEETIRDLMELYEYTKDKEFLFVSFKIKGIEINVKDIDKLYYTEC